MRALFIIVIIATLLGCNDEPTPSANAPQETSANHDARNMGQGPARALSRGWVMRNARGEVIDATVTPNYASTPAEDAGGIDNPAYSCVRLDSLDGVPYHGISFELETGEMKGCYTDFGNTYHVQNDCTDTPKLHIPGTFLVEGELLSAWGPPHTVRPNFYYIKSGHDCYHRQNSQRLSLWELKPTPPTIQNLLGDPPYTISFE